MKILITGANGLLGQHLVKLCLDNDLSVVATGKGTSRLPFADSERFCYYSADITKPFDLHYVMEEEKPDVFVHAAAMTQIDECELNQDACFEVNVQGTIHALMDAEAQDCFFIYLSTDFVFDGEKGNYTEGDQHNPVNWYGFTKVHAESMVETSSLHWAIIRTCLVYGNPVSGTRSNIISWVKDSLRKGEPIRVVNDQVRTPTFVEDLADGILKVIQQRATGVFHISGSEVLTPYQMALETARLLQLDETLITKVDASVFTQPARRPQKTGFDISKAREELGFAPHNFAEGLRKSV